jgi:hypothetical protein
MAFVNADKYLDTPTLFNTHVILCRPPYLRGAPEWLDGEVGKVSLMDKDTAQTTPHELTQ